MSEPGARQRVVQARGYSHNGQPLVFTGQNSLARSANAAATVPCSSNRAKEMIEERRQGKTLGRNQRLSRSLPSGRKISATGHRD